MEINKLFKIPNYIIILSTLFLWGGVELKAQNIALKHNFAYDALLTPNLSLEATLSNKVTLDLQVGVNSFLYATDVQSSDYKVDKFSHWLVQPEIRYWQCEKFNGLFLGFHTLGGQYNIGKKNVPFILGTKGSEIEKYRYEGWFAGCGIGLGYQFYLSKKLSLEAELGVGYAYVSYDRYDCFTCGTRSKTGYANYVGPTKMNLTVVYYLW